MLNDMKFKNINNSTDTFFRLSTKLPDDVPTPLPLLTMGNSISSVRHHEATPDMSQLEIDVLTMTGYLYSQLDEVETEVIKIVSCVLDNTNNKRHAHHSTRSEVVLYPIADKKPIDFPDSVATHVSQNKPYTPHVDAGRLKPCNHSNESFLHHTCRMRIATHCAVVPKQVGKKVPDGIVSIRHSSFPLGDGNYNFCEYLGHFTNRSATFSDSKNTDQAIIKIRSIQGTYDGRILWILASRLCFFN